MNETEFAYAVARIRAKELSLLSPDDIAQMINAPDAAGAERILSDKGWDIPENGQSFDIFERELEKAISFIRESIPDCPLADALIISNDFSNLKAAIKCTFSGISPDEYYVRPCITETDILTDSISRADFEALPEHLRECAENAYHAVSKHRSGQLAESIIDKASVNARLGYAEKSGSGLLMKIAKLYAASADIKTALRCVSTGKSRDFALSYLCGIFDGDALLNNAESSEKLSEYIASTEFAFLSESIGNGFTAFEKFCDNTVSKYIREEKYEIYGADPVAAYYYAKLTEAKNARIILSAKASGVPSEAISERVRDMYV